MLFGIILVLPWYFNTSNVFADEFNEIILPSSSLATVAPRMAWLQWRTEGAEGAIRPGWRGAAKKGKKEKNKKEKREKIY